MIPSQISREELERFVIDHTIQCIRNYLPFREGHFYEYDIGDHDNYVYDEAQTCFNFTDEELAEYFEEVILD